MKKRLKNTFFRTWYWYISRIDKNAEVTFMNYGYWNDNHRIKLDKNDEKDRYSIQLYNLVASGADIKGKDVLEVGCGRGGGLSYISRYLLPRSATGVDLSKKAIEFCNKNYSIESINFLQENAQDLSFQDQSFDIEISVESAHRYSHMDTFLYEVYRVLKPGGFFLFTDFGSETELEKLKTQLKNSNLQLVKDKNITYNVVKALTLATPSRDKLIKKLMPKFLQYLSKNFAGTEGTPTYNKFLAREYEYVFYVLTK